MLKIKNIYFSYNHATPLLSNISFSINKRDFLFILGPNGAGKTTLILILLKYLTPKKGDIYFNKINLKNISLANYAKQVAYIPQNFQVNFNISVLEYLKLARSPYLTYLSKLNKIDLHIIEKNILLLKLENLINKNIHQLSGGERQKVEIARALIQQPKILFIDEPINHLDIKAQIEIMSTIKSLNQNHKLTVIATVHDINIAKKYGEKILLLKHGKIQQFGITQDILIKENLEKTFDINLKTHLY